MSWGRGILAVLLCAPAGAAAADEAPAGDVVAPRAEASGVDEPSAAPALPTLTLTLDPGALERLPLGPTSAAGLLLLAPGARDRFGVGLGGASSLETTVVLDGVDTSDVIDGSLTTRVPLGFLDHATLAWGDLDPSLGGSLGGALALSGRRGGDRWRGAAWLGLRPWQAGADDVGQDGLTFRRRSHDDVAAEAGVEAGGPVIPGRLWAWAGFAPSAVWRTVTRTVAMQVDRDQNGVPDPGNGVPALVAVDSSQIAAPSTALVFAARVDYAPRPEHQGAVSVWVDDERARTVGVNGTPIATQRDEHARRVDASARWRSRFPGVRTEVAVSLGWHHDRTSEAPIQEQQAGRGLRYAPQASASFDSLGDVGRNPDAPERAQVLRLCTDDDPVLADPYPEIVNCPVSGYAWDGPGFLRDVQQDRGLARVTVGHDLPLAGRHHLEGGAELTREAVIDRGDLTGDRRYTWNAGLWEAAYQARRADTAQGICGFEDRDGDGSVTDPIPCAVVTDPVDRAASLRARAWLGDRWTVAPGLVVDVGAQVSTQAVPTSSSYAGAIDPLWLRPVGDQAFSLAGVSPWAGASWDPAGDGSSQVYVRARRQVEPMDLGVARRAFSAPELVGWALSCPGVPSGGDDAHTLRLDQDPRSCDATPDSRNAVNVDSFLTPIQASVVVAPGIRPGAQDELVVGGSWRLAEGTTVAAGYQGRRVERVVEDVVVDRDFTYVIANPGEDVDTGALEAQRDALPAGDPRRALLDRRIGLFQKIGAVPRPRRRHDAVHLGFSHRFAGAQPWFLDARYTWTRLEGNYQGGLYGDTGQVDPATSSRWDDRWLMVNSDGPLPGDRTHQLTVLGATELPLGDAGTVSAGAVLSARSGAPVNLLGRAVIFGSDEIHVLPRGAGGRTSAEWQVDVRLAYRRPVSARSTLTVFVDVYNLFDQQAAVAVDETYTVDRVAPIDGGDAGDLRHLRRLDGAGRELPTLARRNAAHGEATERQAPIALRLGLRLDF